MIPESPEGGKKKRRKGQNKNRDQYSTRREPCENRLCKSFLNDSCTFGESCKFSHDVKAFIEKKPADIGEKCYNFDTFGKCPYNFACRFAKAHIKEVDGKTVNVVIETEVPPSSRNINSLSTENLQLLRKHKYNFNKAVKATKEAQAFVDKIVKENVEKNNSCKKQRSGDSESEAVPDSITTTQGSGEPVAIETSENDKDAEKPGTAEPGKKEREDNSNGTTNGGSGQPVGSLTNEDEFTIKPGEKKTIDFNNKLYLAPLTTVSISIRSMSPSPSLCCRLFKCLLVVFM